MRSPAENQPFPDSTSTSLIRRIRAFDEESWSELVHIYGPLVYATCRRRGLGEHDAEDLVQTVFSTVFSAIHRFRRERVDDTFRGWLRKITRDLVADYFRASQEAEAVGGTTGQIRIGALVGEIPESVEEPDPGELPQNETAQLCHSAIAILRPQFEDQVWDSFIRTTFHGDRATDVARDLKISISAVYKSKTRVLNKLRQLLADE